WRTTERTTRSGKVQVGRYPGSETDPIVQAGHKDAYAGGGPQTFLPEDADLNITCGAVIERQGAIHSKASLLVAMPHGTGAVAVELESLKQWERLGVVPQGTTARAVEQTAAGNAAGGIK